MRTRATAYISSVLAGIVGIAMCFTPALVAEETIVPRLGQTIELSRGDDLSQFTTWLKDTQHDDPRRVFSIRDGVIRVSGEGAGYLATKDSYRDYHLSLEYKWGERTDGSGIVRNSGVLLHGTGPHGAARGVWMASVEVQLAQGCEGDLIVIRGKDSKGETIPVTLTSDTRLAEDNRTRWQRGGKPTLYSGRQFWWSNHQPGFEEKLDTRGRDDVASPLGHWTRVDCLCRGDRITVKINGVTVNEAYNVFPAAGKILLQNEGNEILFRNVRIQSLPRDDSDSTSERKP
ncbi:MAG: DUF1080 domain-containing protein [Pirellulaceae bacterium]